MNDVMPLWIARLAGDQETMGRQHGELIGGTEGIDRVLAYYPEMPERVLVGDGVGAKHRAMRAAVSAAKHAALLALDRDRPDDFARRSRAFMIAAGRPGRDARYGGVMDLLQNVVGVASRLGVGPFARLASRAAQAAAMPACSTVMAWGASSADGVMRHARTFDFPGIGVWDLAPALILCKPERGMRYGFIATRAVDAPCVTVFNEAGIVVTSHTRFHRAVRLRGAAIVDIVHAIGARAETLADAARIAAERPSASTWGLAVSSARERRTIAIELHGERARVVEPAAGASFQVVANRYHHPEMQPGQVAASAAWALQSEHRERRLRASMLGAGRPLGAADLLGLLADREEPDAPGVRRHLGGVVAQGNNVHTVCVEIEQQALVLGVGPAPVCDGPFVRLTFDWDGPVGAWETSAPGVDVVPFDVPGATRSVAAQEVAAAIREEQSTHDPRATAAALERAIAAAPDDPSLRLAATFTHLRRGEGARALAHARAGLVRETTPYRRGQLLLWGARAAVAARDDVAAASLWDELERLSGRGAEVDELCAEGRADRAQPKAWRTRRPDVNLFMLDAA